MDKENLIRFGFFLGGFVVVAVWEILVSRRRLTTPKRPRWFSNLGIVFINTLLIHWLLPITAMGASLVSEARGWGLLHHVGCPPGVAVVLTIFVMDLVIYLQHVLFHFVPVFWRLHRVHHTDLDFDVTTALRFHPIEICVSMVIKIGVVLILGAPLLGVLIFEILLNATAMFNHGNIALPRVIDRVVRLFLVTPDMHRVHHSILRRETNSNFGFNLPWWDRLFRTYIDQPKEGHEGMVIGIPQFRDARSRNLPWLLAMPFVRDKAACANSVSL